MTTNDQFARACNQVEGQKRIQIEIYQGQQGEFQWSALLGSYDILDDMLDIMNRVICDKEMDVASWRQFGKSIKTSTTIKELSLMGVLQETNPEVAQCLRAFFEEINENKTIVALEIHFNVCMAIPALDLRKFFQNNHRLRQVTFRANDRWISPAQSAHLSAVLRDLSLKNIIIDCIRFANDGTFEQVLFACQKMKRLRLLDFTKNYQLSTIAEWLQNPMTLLPELVLQLHRFFSIDMDIERVENEILASLARNTKLQALGVHGLFQNDESKERIKRLLCNNTSIEGIIQSNHSLQEILIYDLEGDIHEIEENETNEPEAPWQECAELNKNPNKNEVIRAKIMQFYFSGDFDKSSILNMPPSVLAHIMGIDVEDKQSAIFNILKSIPELCSASSSDGGGSQSHTSLADDSVGCNKRQKTDT